MYLFNKLVFILLWIGLTIQGCSNEKVKNFQPTQHALVIGINKYQHNETLPNQEGAVNDAKLLTETLRSAKVQLPNERVLLDAKATRSAVIDAWQEMLAQATPGDTIIVTFSGYGGQQTDISPIDEKDDKDEILLFHDFNPKQPDKGRITDDELYKLFNEARDYKVLFLADTSYSSDTIRPITRSINNSRTGGFWNIPAKTSKTSSKFSTQVVQEQLPSHVTLIKAANHDNLQIAEMVFDGKVHGALSWFFSQAVNGQADGNQNGSLERNELTNFLTEKVSTNTKQRQKPQLLPATNNSTVLKLNRIFQPSLTQTTLSKINIAVQHGNAPQGLEHIHFVSLKQADLRFVIKREQTEVFNHFGDKITNLLSDELESWQRIIDKERFLRSLATRFAMDLQPIRITLKDGDKLYKEGDVLHFSITPGEPKEGLEALVLFNLARNGDLQFLYPLSKYKDPLTIHKFPYTLPVTKVIPPFGNDDLVVILCNQPVKALHNLLIRADPNIPEPTQFINMLRNIRCQIGQYAFFSE